MKTLYLHLDNDGPGRLAARAILAAIPEGYEVKNRPPPQGKDVNDFLCHRLGDSHPQRKRKGAGTMKEYDITIRETLEMTVTVEAESREEARQKVADNWKNGEYILDAESFKDVEFYPRGRSRDRDGR